MGLENLVRSAVLSIALAVGSYSCGGTEETGETGSVCVSNDDCKGGRECVDGKCGSPGEGEGEGRNDKSKQLCGRVWLDCEGLRNANYQVGNSYDNCLQESSTFFEETKQSHYAKMINERINCIINSQKCYDLEIDVCKIGGGNLFEGCAPSWAWCNFPDIEKERIREWCGVSECAYFVRNFRCSLPASWDILKYYKNNCEPECSTEQCCIELSKCIEKKGALEAFNQDECKCILF